MTHVPARRRPALLRVGVASLVASIILSALGWSVALAAPLGFGTVTIGATSSRSIPLPLTYSLSEIPPDTVVYAGGNAGVDFALSTVGLGVPLTAGALYGAIGEVTATFHLALDTDVATDFDVSNGDCPTATGSCTAVIDFTPTASGLRTDQVLASIVDLQLSGGGSYASLIAFLAPFLESSVEEQLRFDVAGTGIDAAAGEPGTVSAVVDVPAAAACLEISTASIDFGTLQLGTQDAPASPAITITNCSTADQAMYANGTDATAPGATWALVSGEATCAGTLGLDAYHLRLDGPGGSNQLGTTNVPIGPLAAGASADHTARIDMACPGSSGAGQTMTLQIVFLATTQE